MLYFLFFFFKQKTAYEMRISDWSSDVCSSDLSTENQEKQLLVWNSYGTSYANADTIRRVIANETMKSTDPVAILVGEDRYAEAGGKIDRDLLSDSDQKWGNPQLAKRPDAGTMETEAERSGEEHGAARIRPNGAEGEGSG